MLFSAVVQRLTFQEIELILLEEHMSKREKKIEFKTFNFEVKGMDEVKGTFEGYASVFGNVDNGGDIVEHGAFTRTINSRGDKPFPILFAHQYREPAIGSASLSEDSLGLKVLGTLFIDRMQKAKDIFFNMKDRVSNSMSFMYDIMQGANDTVNGETIRRLKELKVFEVSLLNTGFGMNDLAGVITMKEEMNLEVREQEKRFKAVEDLLQDLKAKVEDKEFKDKIEKDLKALQLKVVELDPCKVITFDTVELARLKTAVQSLTDQIVSDLKK
jgi:uncharacterized protein